jgi:hypothetical protein
MQLKFRPPYALLYRAQWVRKGEEGNTHGFSKADYVGRLRLDAQEIPAALAAKLTEAEREKVEQRICTPARERALAEAERQRQHQLDPVWRLQQALALVQEATPLCAQTPVPAGILSALKDAAAALPQAAAGSSTEQAASDPLQQALAAVSQAAAAVRQGHYGDAPKGNARHTTVYRYWEQMQAAVSGEADSSLLRALQQRGFVKRRRQGDA